MLRNRGIPFFYVPVYRSSYGIAKNGMYRGMYRCTAMYRDVPPCPALDVPLIIISILAIRIIIMGHVRYRKAYATF
jgi:hypothetical protein